MYALFVGVSPLFSRGLKKNRINIVEMSEVTFPQELFVALKSLKFDVMVIHLSRLNWSDDVAREFRKVKVELPIIGIAEKNQDKWTDRRANFLENGGDDLLKISTSFREFLATLRSVVKRSRKILPDLINFKIGEMTMQIEKNLGKVWINSKEVSLSNHEAQLIRLLAMIAPSPLKTSDVELYLFGPESHLAKSSIRSIVKRTRQKLETVEKGASAFIISLANSGYKMPQPDSISETISAE